MEPSSTHIPLTLWAHPAESLPNTMLTELLAQRHFWICAWCLMRNIKIYLLK
jgi:hypothetical protein